MSTTQDCFTNVIGLSQTPCPCYQDEQPSDYDLSESGLFLDTTEGIDLNVVKAAADCQRGNLWELMNAARAEGILAYKTDLMNYIGTLTIRKRNYFNGVIGDSAKVRPMDVTAYNFAGWTWKCAIVRSGAMKLKRLGLVFETTGTFNVILYNNQSNNPITSWNVTTQGGEVTWVTLPSVLSLPMATAEPKNIQYWLIYQTASAPNPMDNGVTCGCGGLGKVNIWNAQGFDNLNPPSAMYNWLEWIKVTGTRGNLLTERETEWTHESKANGLLLDAEFVCNAGEILCKESLDFINDPLNMVMAYTIRYKAAELLLEKILASTNLNRYTMLDRERLWGKRNHFRKEYQDRIKYLGDELIGQQRINLISDCLSCKNTWGFQRGNLIITDHSEKIY